MLLVGGLDTHHPVMGAHQGTPQHVPGGPQAAIQDPEMEDPDDEQQPEQGQRHGQQPERHHWHRHIEHQQPQAQHHQVEPFEPDLSAQQRVAGRADPLWDCAGRRPPEPRPGANIAVIHTAAPITAATRD